VTVFATRTSAASPPAVSRSPSAAATELAASRHRDLFAQRCRSPARAAVNLTVDDQRVMTVPQS